MLIQQSDNCIIINDRQYLDIRDTLTCGQVFRYYADGDGSYTVYSWDKCCHIEQQGCIVKIYADDTAYWRGYFDLDADYHNKSISLASHGELAQEVCKVGQGIRILRQNIEETIISFIISANNNIVRIRKIIERLCCQLGDRIGSQERDYAFPTMQCLADAPIEVFAEAGCGYRSSYIKETATTLLQLDCNQLTTLDTKQARQQLLILKGVGPKVADCILLFGYGKGDVVPVDTWIKKVYHKYYESGHNDKDIADYLCSLWGDNAGLMQQYLFYYERRLDKISSVL